MTTCRQLDQLYTDIKATPVLTYYRYFTSRSKYSPTSKVCNRLIDFSTQLQAYLVSEGFDVEYKVVASCLTNPVQDVWIYWDRGKHRGWRLHVSISSIELNGAHYTTVRALLTYLSDYKVRYLEYATQEAREEVIRTQCTTCYYGGEPYCGLGMDMVHDCMHRIEG